MSFKRYGLVFLKLMLIVALVAGCSGKSKAINTPGKLATNEHALKAVNLKMMLIGDAPADLDIVLEELNKLIKRDLNATLSIEYIAWSDLGQKYTLLLSSGETMDLIYTSNWQKYASEATKGAFVEVTDEILTNYMPLTKVTQNPVSWEQAKINGKIYFVPKNHSTFTGENVVAIRGDLREKYGMGPLESVDDLKRYLDLVAENEVGMQAYAASQSNESLRIIMQEQDKQIIGLGYFQYHWSDHDTLTADKIEYKFDSPSFIEFVKEMKEWSEKGYWSRDAISNKTTVRDAFENGTSASLIWNVGATSLAAAKILETNPDWKPEIYDITPDSVKQIALFISDGLAVPISSKSPERAFMLLDKLKNDRTYYELFQMGIEGKHWIRIDDTLWREGPDSERFLPFSNGQWGVNNSKFDLLKENEFPTSRELTDQWIEKVQYPVTQTFVFDETNVKNELAALEQLRSKYFPVLVLGMVEDVEATINEWREQADKAGLRMVENEMKQQLQAFLDSL